MDDIKQGFIRQRRNMLVVTVAIFLSYWWGIEFKTLNFLGNEIDLKQGNNVYSFLWILLLYWSWRYRNYMRELGPLGIVETLDESRCKLFNDWLQLAGREEDFWEKTNYDVVGQGQLEAKDIDKIIIDSPLIKIFQRKVKASINTVDNPQPWRGDNVAITLCMSPWRLFVINYKSAFFLVNDTRLFSEYVLPPLLVLLFVFYWLWQEFGSRLLNCL